MTFTPQFVPLALLVLCAVGLAGLICLHRWRYGRSPIRLFRSGSTVQTAREVGMILTALVLLWQAIATAFALYVPPTVGTPLFRSLPGLGALVFISGLFLIKLAILTMGASWQIGFDRQVRPAGGLITSGMFRVTRNPIYLGMVIAFAGWTLLIPSLLSLLILAGVASGVRRQAIDEEAYLMKNFGEEFRRWAREVGRFVPWIGRLE